MSEPRCAVFLEMGLTCAGWNDLTVINDRLRRERAEARGLLDHAHSVLPPEHSALADRIDDFLAATGGER